MGINTLSENDKETNVDSGSIASHQKQIQRAPSVNGELQRVTRCLRQISAAPLKRELRAIEKDEAADNKHTQRRGTRRSVSKRRLPSLESDRGTVLENGVSQCNQVIKEHLKIDAEHGNCGSEPASTKASLHPFESLDLLRDLFSQRHFVVKPTVIHVYNVTENTEVEHPESVEGISWNRFREEKFRLRSFVKYPLTAAKSAVLLAEDGFIYTGKGEERDDAVTCYFCCVQKLGWQTRDIVSDIHREMSPNCPMVTKMNCDNIPFTSCKSDDRHFGALLNQLKSTCGSGIDDRAFKPNSADGLDTDGLAGQRLLNSSTEYGHGAEQRNSGLYPHTSGLGNPSASGKSNGAKCTECAHKRTVHSKTSTVEPLLNISGSRSQSQTTEQSHMSSTSTQSCPGQTFNRCTQVATSNNITTTATGSTATATHVQRKPSTAVSSTQTQSTSQNRVSSPAHNPPLNASTNHLENIPTSASLTISSTAVIPKSPQPSAASDVRNSSTTDSNTTSTTASNTTPDTTLADHKEGVASTSSAPNERKRGKGPTYAELGIITERPKRPEYAVRENRLKTFDRWPPHHQLKPEDLSDAGFYFAGYGDCARCFYCGGGLRNWEDEDDVWVEHARWFPKCAYIRQQMGQVFVDTVQELNKTFDLIPFSLVMEHCKTPGAASSLADKTEPLKRDPAVRTVVEFGYSLEDVLGVAKAIKGIDVILSSDVLLTKLRELKKPRNIKTSSETTGVESAASASEEEEEAIRRIKEKNNQLRQQTVCKICMDKEVAVVFLPCGHLVSCAECASAMKDCPVCRVNVKGVVRAIL